MVNHGRTEVFGPTVDLEVCWVPSGQKTSIKYFIS